MPRWASRLTLTITDVRVQRLQDISEEDARAEGSYPEFEIDLATFFSGRDFQPENSSTHYLGFKHLWDRLNAKRGYGWDTNPEVVALTFTVRKRNIDG